MVSIPRPRSVPRANPLLESSDLSSSHRAFVLCVRRAERYDAGACTSTVIKQFLCTVATRACTKPNVFVGLLTAEIFFGMLEITMSNPKTHSSHEALRTRESHRNYWRCGQVPLENAAKSVGKTVRRMMQETSGTAPETLPLADNVKEVRKRIKGAGKNLQSIDKKKSSKKKSS